MSDTDIEIRNIEAARVVYLPMRGPYAQIPDAMGRMYGWMAQHGLQPAGMPGATYFSAPGEVPESDAAWELHTAVANAPATHEPDAAGCGVRDNPPMAVASIVHKGPYETVGATYNHLGAWVVANGYTMSGPPSEYYLTDPNEVPPEEYLTEVQFPIAQR